MTEKQKIFCDRYLIHRNASKAAIEAGYSPTSSRSTSSDLMANEEIKTYIQEKLAIIADKAEIDAVWVLKRFQEVANRCLQAEPVYIWNGEEWVESGEYKFDSIGVINATKEIGKHIGFYAVDNSQKAERVQLLRNDPLQDPLNDNDSPLTDGDASDDSLT